MRINPIYKEMLSDLECDENGDPTPEIIILAEDFGFSDLYIEENEINNNKQLNENERKS